MENKFTWGDPIIISKSAPISFHPGEFASVCGFYKNTSEEAAKEFQCKHEKEEIEGQRKSFFSPK